MAHSSSETDVEILGARPGAFDPVLTDEAIDFVAGLERESSGRRHELLLARDERQSRIDAGEMPDFRVETADIRAGSWTVPSVPPDLRDRRVEITGPVDRKMIINGLNSGAKVFMADFEDANSPTWANVVGGQLNLMDAVRGTIDFTSPEGKRYSPAEETAVLMVRPRGWHLDEKHVLVDGKPMSASLFDFGMYFFGNAHALLERDTGPYFYLPKLESHLEARLWNDVFLYSQEKLGIPSGTIKATVLIENILASFEMHEILYELREHSSGLNCGRWDYIFSAIRKFRNRPGFVLPDRSLVTMTTHFMRSYSLLCIQTCHMRGIHAMGGMAAQIPIKNDPTANDAALGKVREDKRREVEDGHDGTWVAHPALVPIASDIFDKDMPQANQIDRKRDDVEVRADDLLDFPSGDITEEGLHTNIHVGIRYLEPWLRGLGCVPINNLMEDAATAEISRAQVWQWAHSPLGVLSNGVDVTPQLISEMLSAELDDTKQSAQAGHQYGRAGELFSRISTGDWIDFLTLAAYDYLE